MGQAGIRSTRHDFHVVRGVRRREKGLFSRGASLGTEEGPKRTTVKGEAAERRGRRDGVSSSGTSRGSSSQYLTAVVTCCCGYIGCRRHGHGQGQKKQVMISVEGWGEGAGEGEGEGEGGDRNESMVA